MLKKLSESGKKIILSTSKPEVFARKILEKFGADDDLNWVLIAKCPAYPE